MRRGFIFCECERCNGSGVPPRSAWVKLAGPLPVNVSLLGAPGLRPAPLFLGPWGLAGREATQGHSSRVPKEWHQSKAMPRPTTRSANGLHAAA